MTRAGRRVRAPEVTRRQRTRRLDLVTVLAVLLPLVTVGALALVRTESVRDTTHPPTLTRLTAATVVCPSAQKGSPDVSASTASNASGMLTVLSGGSSSSVPVTPHALAPLKGPDAQVVKAADDLAPGLVALRSGTAPLNATDCTVPLADQWFTGLGARAPHDSVIELTNPDSGPAVAAINFFGAREFSNSHLRGLTIPGHKTVSVDLGKVVPRRSALSAEVVVSRGRLGVAVLDTRTGLVTHRSTSEWLPRQLEPATENDLLGLPTGAGTRYLQLANPGQEVVRAQIEVITADTQFAPRGLAPVSVPPGATVTVSLTQALTQALKDGALGVAVKSDGPLTASVLTQLPRDRALTVPDATITHEAATLLPTVPGHGKKHTGATTATLHIAADAAGAAQVTTYDASGATLQTRTVALQQGRIVSVTLPRGAAFLDVVPQRTTIRAAVVVTGAGATVLPLHELLTQGLVPQIWPGQD
jgi:Family of unknown function (DUF5719)